jgi:hypothetical protein
MAIRFIMILRRVSLVVLVLFMIVSCKKDETIHNEPIMSPKIVELEKYGKITPKKRKFKLFKRKRYKGLKYYSKTS